MGFINLFVLDALLWCDGGSGSYFFVLQKMVLMVLKCPDLLFLAFLENGKENHQKSKASSACRTPKILGEKRKTAQNRQEFLEKERARKTQKARRRRLGWSLKTFRKFERAVAVLRRRTWPGEGSTVQWKWSPPFPGSLKALLFPPLIKQSRK